MTHLKISRWWKTFLCALISANAYFGEGSLSNQVQLQPDSTVAAGECGSAVAIDGGVAAFGCRMQGFTGGYVNVFERDGTAWNRVQTIAGRASELFGQEAVAVRGDTLVVGASRDTTKGVDAGAVHVFLRISGGNYVHSQLLSLNESDSASGSLFGTSLSLDDNTLLIGAPMQRSRGGAVIFERGGAMRSWSFKEALVVGDESIGAYFGQSVALSGSTAVVSAPDQQLAGLVYVFERGPTAWVLMSSLRPKSSVQGHGHSISVHGTTIFAAPRIDLVERSGSFFVYTRDDALGWEFAQVIVPTDGSPIDQFGYSVALSGDRGIVSAPGRDLVHELRRGANGTWSIVAQLSGTSGSNFGAALAMGDVAAIVGGPRSGSVFVYHTGATATSSTTSTPTSSVGTSGVNAPTSSMSSTDSSSTVAVTEEEDDTSLQLVVVAVVGALGTLLLFALICSLVVIQRRRKRRRGGVGSRFSGTGHTAAAARLSRGSRRSSVQRRSTAIPRLAQNNQYMQMYSTAPVMPPEYVAMPARRSEAVGAGYVDCIARRPRAQEGLYTSLQLTRPAEYGMLNLADRQYEGGNFGFD